jgi:hypothetical protein
MTWIIRDGAIINPGGEAIRISGAPGDVRVSNMFLAGSTIFAVGDDAVSGPPRLSHLIQLLRQNLGSFSARRERHRAAEILDEVEADPTTERARRGLKVIYDMSTSTGASPISHMLGPFADWFPR